MSSAIAAYFVAAAFRICFHLSNEEAVKQAADLWRLISEKL
jgi:hypothetical protein